MYRIRLNHGGPGWAYHRRCVALQKYAPDDFQVDVGAWHPCLHRDIWPADVRYDLILQLVPDQQNVRWLLDQRGQGETIIVGGLNVGFGRHEKRLEMISHGSDHIVVNNRDCWRQLGKPKGMTWISNGVDRDIFRVTVPVAERTPKVIWTGCDYHCEQTTVKGWAEFLLPLRERLEKRGIPVELLNVPADSPKACLSTEEMVRWYNGATIYVCASSSEGTPNPALEAASCGCVVVSTQVGNMPELIEPGVNGELADRDVDDLEAAVLRCQERYVEMAAAMEERIAGWDWKQRACQYYELFRRLVDKLR